MSFVIVSYRSRQSPCRSILWVAIMYDSRKYFRLFSKLAFQAKSLTNLVPLNIILLITNKDWVLCSNLEVGKANLHESCIIKYADWLTICRQIMKLLLLKHEEWHFCFNSRIYAKESGNNMFYEMKTSGIFEQMLEF